jgi:hypothetical protein
MSVQVRLFGDRFKRTGKMWIWWDICGIEAGHDCTFFYGCRNIDHHLGTSLLVYKEVDLLEIGDIFRYVHAPTGDK